jgi:SNF family Na+-dependent transporter
MGRDGHVSGLRAKLGVVTFAAAFRRAVEIAWLLYINLVDIAPAPVFSGFERLNNRMMNLVKVFSRVLVLRAVATSDVAAAEAEAQMNPGVAHFKAFFTAFAAGLHFFDFAEMSALVGH